MTTMVSIKLLHPNYNTLKAYYNTLAITNTRSRIAIVNFPFRSSSSCSVSKENPRNSSEESTTSSNLYGGVIPKIGLEIHAQLKLDSKLFSRGATSTQSATNSSLDLLDITLPGSLPSLNRSALDAAILTSLGLNCKIQDEIHFDRKNYFYPDMPAGFQITQYNKPIAKDGFIEFIVGTYHKSLIAHSQQYDLVKYLYAEERVDVEDLQPYIKKSVIKQIQLEQDSAKTLHQTSSTETDLCNLIDYNRSGAALIEIVLEPDLTNHHEASSLVEELVNILGALRTCDCEMHEGSLRVDANVSIYSIAGKEVENPCRVELKNLNSIRSLNRGIYYEIKRQVKLIKSGQDVIQETRTFDAKKGQTVPLRIKEDAVDYRYVPEPNIPLMQIDQESLHGIQKELPSKDLPSLRRDSLINEFKLDLLLVKDLMDEPYLSTYFRDIMQGKEKYDANVIADFLIYTIANLKQSSSLSGMNVEVDLMDNSEFMKRMNPVKIQLILDMMLENVVSFTTAYELIKYIYISNDKSDPKKIVDQFNWYQINDREQIDVLVEDCITKMKNVSKRYKRDGEKRHLRLMIDKLCFLTDNKISVLGAIESINRKLRPSADKNKS